MPKAGKAKQAKASKGKAKGGINWNADLNTLEDQLNAESLKALKGHLVKFSKLKQPERSDTDAKNATLQTSIHNWTCEINNLSWKIEREYENLEQAHQMKKSARDTLNKSTSALQQSYSLHNAANKQVKGLYSGRRFRNTADAKKVLNSLKNERKQKVTSLRADSLTIAEERDTERDIKLLDGNIESVQQYLDSNVGEKMEDVSVLRNDIDTSKKAHEADFEKFSAQKRNVDAIKGSIDELKDTRKATQDKIIDAKKRKTLNLEEFNKSCEKYEKDRAVVSKLRAMIALKRIRETEAKYDASYTEKHNEKMAKKNAVTKAAADKKAAHQKQQNDKIAAQEQERLEKQQAAQAILEERKRKAKEAYEAQQKQLASQARAAKTPVSKSFSKPQPKPSEIDPNSEEKRTIQGLIDMFKGMQPNQNTDSPNRRGKKKRRNKNKKIVLTVDVYSKLTSFGVKVPKKTTDFVDTIKSLQDKLNSYGNENEDVKESVDEPVAVQTNEETV